MADNLTQDEVVEAARALERPEFTRDDVAQQLGLERRQIREGFKAARQAGRLEKVRQDDEGNRYFRVAGD